MGSNDRFSGFEVELWESIAKRADLDFIFEKYDTFQELLRLVGQAKTDVALAAITINEEREEVMDFSHPTFDSGLGILLSKQRGNVNIASTIRTFVNQGWRQLLKPGLVLVVMVFVFGNILWLAEKSVGSFATTYNPGFFQAMWVSLSALIGSDGAMFVYTVHTWPGRAILALGQITNLAVLGLLVGELTAFITARKIRLNIESPDDLRGKTVATVKGTTSETALKNLGATPLALPTIENAYEKLKKNQVDAVVFDAPILLYYALNEGSEWAEIVGKSFDKQYYGIALPNNSTLRKVINQSLLTMRENGEYDALYKKWFEEKQ